MTDDFIIWIGPQLEQINEEKQNSFLSLCPSGLLKKERKARQEERMFCNE